jgi:IclR family KDG regulon transcriptional repressor
LKSTVRKEMNAMSEVLNKAFTLLHLLKPRDEIKEWTAAELARIAGFNTATTHRILQDLTEFKIVSQNKENKKFHLGYSLIELGSLAKGLFTIRDLARPFMEEIEKITNESVYLTIPVDDKEGLLLDSIDSTHQLRIVEPLGERLPLHKGAARKVLLAYMSKEKQEEYINNYSLLLGKEKEIYKTEEELREEIKKIRDRGYSLSIGETVPGTAGVGVPIFGINGVEGSLCIGTPESRLDKDRITEYVELLLGYSRKISSALGK